MIEKPPPNFATWTLKETLSLFIESETQKLIRKPPEAGDCRAPRWIAYENIYLTPDGFGRGKEWVFFGKHAFLIFWGIEGGETYEFFSVFHNGRWESFSNDNKAMIAAVVEKDKLDFIVMCRIAVRRRNDQEILRFFVERN